MQADSLPIRGGNQDLFYTDCLRKFDYGPAQASKNHCYTVCNKNRQILWKAWKILICDKNSFFVAIALYHKVFYTSKGLTSFLKRVSHVFRKIGVVLNKMELEALHLTLKQCLWVLRMARMCISRCCCSCSFNNGSILSLQQ